MADKLIYIPLVVETFGHLSLRGESQSKNRHVTRHKNEGDYGRSGKENP